MQKNALFLISTQVMNQGHYVFSQVVKFLPHRYFERLVSNTPDRTQKWSFTHWNQLLVLMFVNYQFAKVCVNYRM